MNKKSIAPIHRLFGGCGTREKKPVIKGIVCLTEIDTAIAKLLNKDLYILTDYWLRDNK
jgi:hypothetical protein